MSGTIERFRMKPGGLAALQTQQSWYPDNSFYKPISINAQGETYCPVGCAGCGIDANARKQDVIKLPIDTRLQILNQAYDAGFISYLGYIGKAEPFTSLEFLGEVLTQFRGRLDCTKINTSCITFTDTDEAVRQFSYLKDNGWTDTTYLVPVLSLSLGMQQEAGVPIERIVNGIEAFHKVFTPEEARLSVSHYHTTKRYFDSVVKLETAYRLKTGRSLHDDAVVKTNEIMDAGRAHNFDTTEFEQFQLRHKVSGMRCFDINLVEYINPVMTVDTRGNIWMCPQFDPHEGTLLGNIHDKTVEQAIIEANANDFFRLIATGGTEAVFEIAQKYEPEIGRTIVTDRCAACAKLYKTFLNSQKFKDELQERVQSK